MTDSGSPGEAFPRSSYQASVAGRFPRRVGEGGLWAPERLWVIVEFSVLLFILPLSFSFLCENLLNYRQARLPMLEWPGAH